MASCVEHTVRDGKGVAGVLLVLKINLKPLRKDSEV